MSERCFTLTAKNAGKFCANIDALLAKSELASSTGYLQRRGRHSGMGGHQSAHMDKDEWLTPPEILNALGDFDLDPCAPIEPPWSTARTHLTLHDNGLRCAWSGRVWLNPPYGPETGKWLGRLAEHGNGIALIFARTETADWVNHVWRSADAVMFLFGRLHFHHRDGSRAKANSGAPSALIAYGQENVTALEKSGISGALLTHWSASGDNGGGERRSE